jgi:hypothetical protein
VALSREWVCVRLASYESEQEGEYLKNIFRGRTGELNNTTFALIAPDGKTLLAPSGRGPEFVIGRRGTPSAPASSDSLRDFTLKLQQEAKAFKPKARITNLPQALDFRRALNIAACDNQPLVVAYAKDADVREKIEALLARNAWDKVFVGRLQYIMVSNRGDLKVLGEIPDGDFLAVVQPGQFGLNGRILRHHDANTLLLDSGDVQLRLKKLLQTGLEEFTRKGLSRQDHHRQGRRAEAFWQTVMPVTDEGKASSNRRRPR